MREPIAAEPGVRDSTLAASEGRGSRLPLAGAAEHHEQQSQRVSEEGERRSEHVW
jgi:hypothetical protein